MFYNNENGSQCSCVLKLCLILLVVLKLSNASFLLGRELPCHFYDSINITDGVHHANQSITFHGIEYPPEQYVEVNYILINGARPVKVTPYIRGCLCSIRACVRLCCPYGSFVTKINTENGIKCRESESVKPIESEIITGYNETSIVNLDKHFAYIDRICNLHSVANDDLKIHKDGSISNKFGENKHNGYCLKVSADKPNLQLMMCMDQPEPFKYKKAKLIIMLTSSFFMAITFIVYISLPELRNFHGKCLGCFLLSLICVFTLYPWIRFSEWNYVPFAIRELIACLMYLSTMWTLTWLNVICIDLYQSFKSTIRLPIFEKIDERNRFFFGAVYAFGLPLILFIIGFPITKSFGSAINYYQRIDSNKNKFRAMEFFLYILPIVIIVTVNVVLFILTAIQIHHQQKKIRAALSQEESSRDHQCIKINTESFFLYLRMFILMGIEVIVLAARGFIRPISHPLIVCADLLTAAHGYFLFILFVLRPHVLKLIKQKFTKENKINIYTLENMRNQLREG